MSLQESGVIAALNIARATSIAGGGMSLAKAMEQTKIDFFELTAPVVRAVLLSQPNYIEDWVRYSQDKRTNGGWYLDGSAHLVGNLEGEETKFDSIILATAEYIVCELQFWANIQRHQHED
jgi:hypothetical protein